MAQNFQTIAATETLQASRQKLLDRDDAAATNFAGTSFPVSDLAVGMRCHRTDQGKIYVLKALVPSATWVEVEDVNGTQGLSPSATILATARNFSITGDGSASAVAFNGSANVALSLSLSTTGVTAGTYAKVTVDTKGRVTAGGSLTNSDLPNSGVAAGTYTKVTVNTKGVVTGTSSLSWGDLPSNPTLIVEKLRANNDTEASPSYSWNSNGSMGMFRKGDGIIGWSTGGVERMTLDGPDLKVNGYFIAKLYNGSSAAENDLPIGHLVIAYAPGINRNATTTLRLDEAGSGRYVNNGTGTVLTGTWRARGYIDGTFDRLFQRVA